MTDRADTGPADARWRDWLGAPWRHRLGWFAAAPALMAFKGGFIAGAAAVIVALAGIAAARMLWGRQAWTAGLFIAVAAPAFTWPAATLLLAASLLGIALSSARLRIVPGVAASILVPGLGMMAGAGLAGPLGSAHLALLVPPIMAAIQHGAFTGIALTGALALAVVLHSMLQTYRPTGAGLKGMVASAFLGAGMILVAAPLVLERVPIGNDRDVGLAVAGLLLMPVVAAIVAGAMLRSGRPETGLPAALFVNTGLLGASAVVPGLPGSLFLAVAVALLGLQLPVVTRLATRRARGRMVVAALIAVAAAWPMRSLALL